MPPDIDSSLLDMPAPPTTPIEDPGPTQPPNQAPPDEAPPPPVNYTGPVATTPQQAVSYAVSAGVARGERVGVAVLDLRTGAFYGSGAVDGSFASASLVKLFIATRVLADGHFSEPGVSDLMWSMITQSDDDAASELYDVVGDEDVIPWVSSRYGITGLAPATIPGWWGLTQVTPRAIVSFYAHMINDQAVAPWLLNAMANVQPNGSDGFYQYFGIPLVTNSWRIKQGWMCCLENVTRMHSTGIINGDRYAVAMLTEGTTSVYGNFGAQTLTIMAQALLPGGTLPSPPPPPSPTPTPTPTPSPTPSASPSTSPKPSQSPSATPSSSKH
jgi:hypothetical protein